MEEASKIRDALARQVAAGRVHSAYLLAGPGGPPRETALWLARALACLRPDAAPCDACASCRRTIGREEIALDGTGKKGPLLRHVGDHPDLFWVERGAEDTRVRIAQVRALQAALRLRGSEPGRRAAVVADAEWLNLEAQSALLRLLEEPPSRTSLILVTASAAGLLATVRSRCQRYAFPAQRPRDPLSSDDPETRALAERLASIGDQDLPQLLDWAEEYRGARAAAAEGVARLLETASAWLHADVRARAEAGGAAKPATRARLEAFRAVHACRKALVQRNANPQMIAERALLALRDAAAVG